MANPITRILKPLTSLKLTVVCLSVAMVLVFIGTLAQQYMDAFYAQKKYFNTWFVWWLSGDIPVWMGTYKLSWLVSWIPAGRQIPVFPGGYLLGSIFLVNLIAAHTVRFKMSWKKSGIFLAHLGLIFLLTGGLFTALWSKDTRMTIAQGGTANYSEMFKEFELAIIDKSHPDRDEVVAIPQSYVEAGMPVQDPHLPFTVKSLSYIVNARMRMREQGRASSAPAMQGMGARMDAVAVPPAVREGEENYPSAVVELQGKGGSLGTWLLWAAPFGTQVPAQTVQVDGKTYEIQLRLKRLYKPYQIHLNKLTHDTYAGTNIPKNYASQIHLIDTAQQENREALIYMNHPLRYRGEAFYQYQTLDGDKFTALEVVDNPVWWLPYISCLLVGGGLIIQFGMHLWNFLKRRAV